MAVMEIMKGNVDHSYEYGSLADFPLLKENEDGKYKVVLYDMHRTTADILVNFTNPDPVWREVIRDIRFRQAMSKAINYDEIIEVVYYGFAQLPVTTPGEYDPDAANKILDEMGMDQRDGDGFRLGPDGNTFLFRMTSDNWFREFVPTGELVREYFQDVGIKTDLRVIEQSLFMQERNANELYASVWFTIIPYLWWMFAGTGSWEAPLWKQWLATNGEQGEEPEQWWLELAQLAFDQLRVAPEEQPAVIDQMSKSCYDNIIWFVTCDWAKYIVCMGGDMGGYAKDGYGTMAQHSAEFFYFDR
jgi:peptide/nickel transport system substrate-binding protein